ncbi:MAG: tetraacyldisaccharide 4'-kinase [Alphaproteobacteria bacterium]|nr:tetraacyldisaccharide 4'-kinase [Alphaproteobacteria bacterium]NCQ67436.1 tetraacyldisaccharide 4'-kinase [Alphaproteobacteria bacterium]NCT08055.1 tetraacyldisaccharide 4'-kinase [Alphaproteobacteria bacterium]
MKEPSFWYTSTATASLRLSVLKVLSALFRFAGIVKKAFTRTRAVDKTVICIGNLTVGGAGKTPVTLSIARYFKGRGKKVAIISRGYKGRLKGPLLVDPTIHTARDVGDEPLLLSLSCTTWISANRYKGAKAAIKKGAEIILLDDGLQHSTLKQDLKICVIDARRGFGNRKVMPAGPLREPLEKGLGRVDAFIVVGNAEGHRLSFDEIKKPLLQAAISINKDDWAVLKNKRLVAFAGIANPEKFFETLRLENFDVQHTIPFPDHHFYTTEDLETLQQTAKEHCADLVTTQKDRVRLPKALQKGIHQLRIQLDYEEPPLFRRLLNPFDKRDKDE